MVTSPNIGLIGLATPEYATGSLSARLHCQRVVNNPSLTNIVIKFGPAKDAPGSLFARLHCPEL